MTMVGCGLSDYRLTNLRAVLQNAQLLLRVQVESLRAIFDNVQNKDSLECISIQQVVDLTKAFGCNLSAGDLMEHLGLHPPLEAKENDAFAITFDVSWTTIVWTSFMKIWLFSNSAI